MTDGSPVESVDRALRLLQALTAAGSGGAGVSELAAQVGLHKTTVHRTLAALRFRDFVSQDAGTGSYRLGPAAVELSGTYLSDENLPVLLHPALVTLCRETQELVHLGVLSGTAVVYIDKVEPERPVRVWSAIGRRSPAITTALGRALLAHRGTDRASLAAYRAAVPTAPSGPSGAAVTEPDAEEEQRLWAVITSARARGWASEREENEEGISCVAVPILRAGSAIAAVSVTAPAERMTDRRLEELHTAMRHLLPPLLPRGLELPPMFAADGAV